MNDQYVIGVDIGTQGTKGCMFSGSGELLSKAFIPSKLLRYAPGVVEEDPHDQVSSVCTVIRQCMEMAAIDPGRIAAIGIDGQMAGLMGVDKEGNHVTPYDSWLDTRCAPYIHKMSETAGHEIIRKTGGPPSFNHGPKILWWKHEHPDVYRRIYAFIQPGAYAAMRLCGKTGKDAFIDSSYLHFSGFADSQAECWDDELCRLFRIDRSKLPRIVRSHEVIGKLTQSQATRCGIKAGVPVIAGCGDTAASFLACGATHKGICVDVAGTACVFAATTGTFCCDTTYGVLAWGHSAVPGLWHPYAYINGGGLNLEWFRKNIVGLQRRPFDLEALNALVLKKKPESNDPLFIPHLGGRVSPSRPELRGAWVGLTTDQTAVELYRAILEGVALEYGIYRDVLLELNPELKLMEIRVTGGGAMSAIWNRIKADILGIPVRPVANSEGAPLGAAMLAAFGAGLLPDLAAAARYWVKPGKYVRPDKTQTGHYHQKLTRYKSVLEILEKWSRQ